MSSVSVPLGLEEIVRDLYHRFAEVERRLQNQKRTGKIHEVDAARGLARVQINVDPETGEPVLTDWIPWQELAMGEIKTHFPPAVGEQVDIQGETGDGTDWMIVTSIPSNKNPRPHNKEGEAMIKVGDNVSLLMTRDRVLFKTPHYRVEAGKVEYQQAGSGAGRPGVPMA